MYYHARPLQFVTYGKVGPPPVDALGGTRWENPYRWLGEHCGFFPQVWLSRSRSRITGYRRWANQPDSLGLILFGFESIQGFGLDYDFWELLLTPLSRTGDFTEQNHHNRQMLDDQLRFHEGELSPLLTTWNETRDLDQVFKKHLFIKNDQVVVPTLNLKTAKEIICRDESEKKHLRKLGFIEDRITIRNTRPGN